MTFQLIVFLLSTTWLALTGCMIQTWSAMDTQARWFAVAQRCSSIAERLALSIALRPIADGVGDECTRALARLYRRDRWQKSIRAMFPMACLFVKEPTDEMLAAGVRGIKRLRRANEEDDDLTRHPAVASGAGAASSS